MNEIFTFEHLFYFKSTINLITTLISKLEGIHMIQFKGNNKLNNVNHML